MIKTKVFTLRHFFTDVTVYRDVYDKHLDPDVYMDAYLDV